MPTAAELVQKANELRKNGSAAAAPVREAKQPRTQLPAGKEDTFERLLRFTLYQQNQVENLQCGATVVYILHDATLKTSMMDSMKLWEDSRPVVSQEDRVKNIWHPHPLGDRKVFLFISLLHACADLGPLKGSHLGASLSKMASLDTELLSVFVGNFAPRFPTPREGRPWVFEMVVGALATDEFRKHLGGLIQASEQMKDRVIRIELARKGQSELKKALWDDLRHIQQSRGQ